MNDKIRLVLAGLLLVALGYLCFENWPRTRHEPYYVNKTESRVRTRDYTTTIMIDGKPREVTVPIEEKYQVAMPEQRTLDILPTLEDYLRIIILCLVTVGASYFFWILLTAFARDKKAGGRMDANQRDTQKRLTIVMPVLLSFLIGFMSARGFFVKFPFSSTNESNNVTPSSNEEFTGPAPMPDQRPTPAVGDPGTPQFTPNPPKK